MTKIKLNSSQIQFLIKENSYEVDEKNKFFSRCIDGRYKNSPNLPALAIPGADLGELAMILAASNSFGFEVDKEKAFESLVEVVGGVKKFAYHTDSHHGGLALGCGHFGQMVKDFVAYNLQKKDIKFLEEKLKFLKKEGVLPTVLEGNHDEGAILIVKGNFGIFPRFIIETEEGQKEVSTFVYQKTLVDERHRILAKKLIEDKAVKLFDNLDEEYLYEVLSEEGEIHLLETLNRLASDLPLFEVIFDNSGRFSLKSLK
jgi:hypothetical protein